MGNNKALRIPVWIGWDSREAVASSVAAHSILKRTPQKIDINYLQHRDLRKNGKFARPWLIDGATGDFVDMIDGRPFSTEFSHTRFLIPHLMHYQGWALFMDADMIFQTDIAKLFSLRQDKYAVMCVKHTHTPQQNAVKMDDRQQHKYYRKNWSSFVLWNCGHHANEALTVEKVNFMKGGDLHAFSWLDDSLIGELPKTYNYISGVSPKCEKPDVIHYTDGGPWFDKCIDVPFAELWTEEYEDWQSNGEHGPKISDVATKAHDAIEIIRRA